MFRFKIEYFAVLLVILIIVTNVVAAVDFKKVPLIQDDLIVDLDSMSFQDSISSGVTFVLCRQFSYM